MPAHPKSTADPKTRSQVVTKAFINATRLLELNTAEIIKLTGISAPSWTRICHHKRLIEVDTKEAEMAILFLRIYRSLDALFGGHDEASRDWLRSKNYYLGGVPIDLMQTVEGLARVTLYLDAMRGRA